jgi:spore germination protein GerM
MLRVLVAVVLLAVAGYAGYRFFAPHTPASPGRGATIYYTKLDGDTLAKWVVSVNPNAADITSVAFYATTQAVAGPPADTAAIRFPSGTVVRSVHVDGSTAAVDLGGAIAASQGGSFAESGEFKALVWTLTSLPGVSAVQVRIDGVRTPTLPGGHLELDEPLTRQSW